MNRFDKWLTGLFVNPNESTTTEVGKAKYGILGGWMGIVVSIILGVVKVALGMTTGSIALIAEAFHSIADAVTSIVVVVFFRISRKPSDAEHPYGHGRAEYIATLVLAVLLIVLSIEFFHTSVDRIREPQKVNVSVIAIVVITLSIFMKEWLARYEEAIGRMINSDSLKADAWHSRSDAVASLFVIVAMIGSWYGYLYLDGIMGIAVALIIGFAGFKILKDAADRLIGEQPSRETIEKIYETAQSVKGVLNVHDVSVHSYGTTKMISLHAQVQQTISPIDAHRIAENIEMSIEGKFDSSRTVVHIDPVDYSSPLVREVVEEIKLFRAEHEDIVAFHDVRVQSEGDERIIELDFASRKGTAHEEDERLKLLLSERLRGKFPGFKTRIDVDPDYFYQRPK
jgi:cation diffusion facilitator family transporter